MKVKDADALRTQISHDPREAFTKHQVWLFASECNKTTPTFDAIPKSVLEDIKADIENMLPDGGVIHKKTVIEIIDKYKGESEIRDGK